MIFQSLEDDLTGPGQFRLMTSWNRLSLQDDFRQLVIHSSFQIQQDDFVLAGPGQLQLVISRNWLGPGKTSSVISLFPVTSSAISPFSVNLPEFLGWEECGG
jgi:hypothetical protein